MLFKVHRSIVLAKSTISIRTRGEICPKVERAIMNIDILPINARFLMLDDVWTELPSFYPSRLALLSAIHIVTREFSTANVANEQAELVKLMFELNSLARVFLAQDEKDKIVQGILTEHALSEAEKKRVSESCTLETAETLVFIRALSELFAAYRLFNKRKLDSVDPTGITRDLLAENK